MAIASRQISNIIARCRVDPLFFDFWSQLCRIGKPIARGLLDNFTKACGELHVQFSPPNTLKCLGITFDFFQLSPKCIRRICRVAACQALYSEAVQGTRNDLRNWGSGVLDEELAPVRVRGVWSHGGASLVDDAIIPGPMTGCLPTADRLYQANMLASPACRWCGFETETIHHLTADCPGIREKLGSPASFFPEQPHFLSHGLWEVPQSILDAARNASTKIELHRIPAVADRVPVFFIHGSATNTDHFYTKTLGFAACDEHGDKIFSHGFVDPFGNCFKAALLAFWNLCRSVDGNAVIYTSNRALVRIWCKMVEIVDIPFNIAFRDIWSHLLSIAKNEQQCRVQLQFLPMKCNAPSLRVVNELAMQAAMGASPVPAAMVRSWRQHVIFQRAWLCRLSKLVQTCKYSEEAVQHGQEVEEAEEAADEPFDFRNRFVRWDWDLPQSSFSWRPTVIQRATPRGWQFSEHWWSVTVAFLQQLQWRVGEGSSCCFSVFELGFLFWHRLRQVPPATSEDVNGTFMVHVNWIRMVLRTCTLGDFLPPNVLYKPKQKSWLSQTFPKGTLQGARAFMTEIEMRHLASFISSLSNGGKTAKDWTVPLVSLP
eukprot:Skav209412  [mRNA]  locus=scaffold1411:28144:29943:+ [translate_table: standard]